MKIKRELAALIGAGVIGFAAFGVALAATGPSDQGVTPTEVQGNITLLGGGGNDKADCAEADGLQTGNSSGSGTTANGVTVEWTYDGTTKEFSFEATGGLVTIAYIKGSNSYNVYDYVGDLGHGVADDGGMFAPDNNNAPAGLSHAVFCTGPGDEETEAPSFEQSQEGETDPPSEPPSDAPSDEVTDAPSFEQSQEGETEPPTNTIGGKSAAPGDGAWLLVVALGVLLASIVVLSPAKASAKR